MRAVMLLLVALSVGSMSASAQKKEPDGPSDNGSDPACVIKDITRAPDGLVVWSPTGDEFIVNKKDAGGTYQLYVGSDKKQPVCITCVERQNGPLANRHKLQPHWHPSGRWIELAGEREKHSKPILVTSKVVEGLVQSGLWVDIYLTRPDGSQWYRLKSFSGGQGGDGFTGVAFTPNGKQAVWAQIVGNAFPFGRWELILADFVEDSHGVPSFTNQRNITPKGATWVETGNFAPDGKSLLISADIGIRDAQGMDQYILDVTTGGVRNLTNSPNLWDEHGRFSPDGRKILYMSSFPFKSNPFRHNTLLLHTEFMLMNSDGSGQHQITHFNWSDYPESNARGRGSVAANGEWRPDGRAISVLNLFFPIYETWTIAFNGSCGGDVRVRSGDPSKRPTGDKP